MAHVVPGRFTAHIDEPFVVFLIGIRVNRPLEVRKWVRTAMAMGPMLR
jgi:Monooxygenase af470-like